ncbi:MAG: GNAT family N-acetyltransferase [Bacteroidales bacterium]|jgi:GNAT superfamily N-acetyltransferase|nr:GNAT family N-acetyltransferase [Bacteroidales bacterium]
MNTFRPATPGDLSAIMPLIADAQRFLRSMGVDQWQNGYPSEEIIRQDIERKNGYVLTVAEGIIAFATVIFSEEPTYQIIYEGTWLSDSEYGVIHRMAVADAHKRKRVGESMFRFIEKMACERQISSMRIDTHEDNIPMQRLIRKTGYAYCGVIYLADGNKRLAFQKTDLF